MLTMSGAARAGSAIVAFLAVTPSLFPVSTHATSVLTTLHAFTGGTKDGRSPFAGLAFDPSGTVLYGTTQFGGTANKGTVFKTDPASGATTILHSFTNLAEGFFPQSGVTVDASGMLYGTTISVPTQGGGAVFKLDPASGKLTVLHSFVGGSDGFFPSASVTLDAAGNIYGTTEFGGGACTEPLGCGTVFRIDRANGSISILHAFTEGQDGSIPLSGLIFGADGALYGQTFEGGSSTCGIAGCGTVFKIDPGTGQLTTLHEFEDGAADGAHPLGNVVFDQTGMIYATTEGGGPKSSGTIYKLDPATGAITILHTFTLLDRNGGFPAAGLTFDAAGKVLYGTTIFGGKPGCKNAGEGACGTVFQFNPRSRKYTVMYRFSGSSDGGNPPGAVVLDAHGVLYSTTEFDGAIKSGGTVFSLVPEHL